MEMQYFRGNIFSLRNKNTVKSASILSSTEDIEKSLEVIQRAIEYVDKKYDIVSIAVAHPEIFYQRVVARCSLESYGDLGMFQVLPGVLISMQKTGKYKVGGM